MCRFAKTDNMIRGLFEHILMSEPFYLRGRGPNVITENEIQVFAQRNPTLSSYFDSYGIELRLLNLSPFQSLVYWIVSQQISGKAADAIISRLDSSLKEVSPIAVCSASEEVFREIGLSRSKIKYVKELATFFQKHPTLNFSEMTDGEIKSVLTQIPGIGEWTVQMFLIFNLGRKNVLAAKDLAVRKGVRQLYHLNTVPKEKEVYQICKTWPDLSTIGTLLSWAVLEE